MSAVQTPQGGEIRAAVFDHDDTCIVTRSSEYIRMAHVGRIYGLDITKETLDESWGMPFEDQLAFVYGDVDTIESVKETYQSLDSQYPRRACEGYIELTRGLKTAGVVLGIVTSHNATMTAEEQAMIGADPEDFLFIHGSEETKPYHKPAKETFDPAVAVLEQHGISRHETVYIGDDLRDHLASENSGWRFVGVTTGVHTAEMFEEAGALVVPSLKHVFGLIVPDAHKVYESLVNDLLPT